MARYGSIFQVLSKVQVGAARAAHELEEGLSMKPTVERVPEFLLTRDDVSVASLTAHGAIPSNFALAPCVMVKTSQPSDAALSLRSKGAVTNFSCFDPLELTVRSSS